MTIRFDNISFRYEPGIEVFAGLTIDIPAGDIVLIVGKNGAGKSTFLKLLNGILRPDSGQITVSGLDTQRHPTSRLAGEVSVTFQNPSHQLFAATVLREAEFAPKNLGRENPRERAVESLRLFHLERHLSAHPYDLSPAKRKLLTLASAVASGAGTLAFDEPSVDLSHPEQTTFLDALATLQRSSKTVLIVSHDLELFLPACSKVLILNEGKATFYGAPELLVANQHLLRRAGIRFPLVYRLRPYFGLQTIPEQAM